MPYWNADHILNLLSFQLTLTASAAPIQAWLGRPDVRSSLEQALTQSAALSGRQDAIAAMQQWLRTHHTASFGSSGNVGAPGEVFAWEHLWGFLSPLLVREERDLPSHDDLMALQTPLSQSTDGLLGQDEVVPVPSFDQRQDAALLAPEKQSLPGGGQAASFQWQEGARQYSAWEGVLGGVATQDAAVVPPSMAMFDEIVEKEDALLSSLSMSTAAASSPLLDDAHVPSPPGLVPSSPPGLSSASLAEAVTPPPPSIPMAPVEAPATPSSAESMEIPDVPLPISPARSFPATTLSDTPPQSADVGTQDFMDAVPLADPGSLFAPEELASLRASGVALPPSNDAKGASLAPLTPAPEPPPADVFAPPAAEALSPPVSEVSQSEWELDAAFESAFSSDSQEGVSKTASPAPASKASASTGDLSLPEHGWASPLPSGEAQVEVSPASPELADAPEFSPPPVLAPVDEEFSPFSFDESADASSAASPEKQPFDPFAGSLDFGEEEGAGPVDSEGSSTGAAPGSAPVSLAPTLKPVAMSPSSADLDVVVGAPVVVEESPAEVAPPSTPKPPAPAVATASPKPPPRPAPLMLNKGLGSGVRQPIGGPGYIQRPGTDGNRRQEERVGPEVLRVPMPQLRMKDSGLIVPNEELLAAMEESPLASTSSQFLRIALILLGVLILLGGAFGLYLYLR